MGSTWTMFFLLYLHHKCWKLLLLIGYLGAILLLKSSRSFFALFVKTSGSCAHLKVIPICLIPCFSHPGDWQLSPCWFFSAPSSHLRSFGVLRAARGIFIVLCCYLHTQCLLSVLKVWFTPPINANLPPINANLPLILISPTWLHGPSADFLLADPKTLPVQHLC